jgi:4-carboxymuconolactone decarboxylase
MPKTDIAAEEALLQLAEGGAPIIETLAMMHLDTLERSGLDERTYHLVRLGALVAMDAAPISYLVNLEVAADDGVTAQDAAGCLVAVAPIVGSARVVSAAGNVLQGFGLDEVMD